MRIVLVLGLAAILVAGCVGSGAASPTPVATAADSPSVSPSAAASVSPAPVPSPSPSVAGPSPTPSATPRSTPAAVASPTPPEGCPTATFHVVKAGDTLAGIAQEYGVSVSALLTANPRVTDPRALQVGTRLIVSPPLDLGTLGGRRAWATDINDAGQVVGLSEDAAGTMHVVLWSEGSVVDIAPTDGGLWEPRINAAGQVLYGLQESGRPSRWFVWDQGELIELSTPDGSFTEASAINDRGHVVGMSDTGAAPSGGNPERHAFLWADGQMHDLGKPGEFSRATAMNARDQVVGMREVGGHQIATLWSDGATIDLMDPDAGPSEARVINERGDVLVVGVSGNYVWQDGRLRDIGTLGGGRTSPVAIADQGWVFGTIWTPTAPTGHPFLWRDGTITDLGTLGGGTANAIGIDGFGRVFGTSTVRYGPNPPTWAYVWRDGVMVEIGSLLVSDVNRCGVVLGHLGDYRPVIMPTLGILD